MLGQTVPKQFFKKIFSAETAGVKKDKVEAKREAVKTKIVKMNAAEQISAAEASCPITITTQPVSQTDCYDNGVEFTAAYNAGGATVTYQWESSTDGISWIPITGAWPNIIGASGSTNTSPITLTVNNIGVGGTNGVNINGTRYRLVITDASGPCTATTDGVATLTVNDITTINPSPSTPSITNVVVCAGTTVTFAAGTQGQTPVSYQWRKDGVNLSNGGAYSGVNTSTLTITNPTTAQTGAYSVTVVFQ